MSRQLVVVGAGGFGRETLDVVEAMNAAGDHPEFHLLGVIDDSPSAINLQRLADRGVTHMGGIDDQLPVLAPGTAYAVAIGRPQVRRALVARLDDAGLVAATLIHPSATIGTQVSIGDGVIICGGVQISTNVRLGCHVQVNPNATIGHDAVLGDYVSINPAATISGECTIEPDSLVGASAVVLQGVTVGTGSVVGAAACVVRGVTAGLTVKGVPAR